MHPDPDSHSDLVPQSSSVGARTSTFGDSLKHEYVSVKERVKDVFDPDLVRFV